MQPVIFADYGNTLDDDIEDSEILLKTLREMKENGATIYLVTGGDNYSAREAIKKLTKRGYGDLFEGFVSYDTFGQPKSSSEFWPQLLEKYGLNAEDTILLDDDYSVLRRALSFGINTVNSLPREEAVEELRAKYKQISARPA